MAWIMNKHLLLILLGFGSFSNVAFTLEKIEFEFSIKCKVTDVFVLGTKDGIPKRYKGFKDGLITGSTCSSDFEFSRKGYHNTLDINSSSFSAYSTFDSIHKTEINDIYSFSSDTGTFEGMFGPDYLFFELLGSIEMTRYYKNDWQLMSRSGGIEGARLLTADCKSMPEEYELAYEYFGKSIFD